jgi:uncharacterized protein YjbI with pentapeptide repeats
MNITCNNCGGKNSLPKGKTSMFCAFCGTNIEAPIKQTIKKETKSTGGSDKERILEYIKGGSKGKLDLPFADLKGIHLKGAILEGAILNGANLMDSFLGGAILKNANLRNANLVNTKFKDADLSGADLSGAELWEEVDSDDEDKCVDFTGANLENVIINNADIGIDFRGVKNLSGADFRGSSFKNACFDYVKLKGINLSGTDLTGAEFGNSDLSNADLSNIISGKEEDIGTDSIHQFGKRIFLAKSKLCNANLKRAQLINADLSNTDLSHADLTGADLRGADFSGAILKGAILRGTDLRGAKFVTFIQRFNPDRYEFSNCADLTATNLEGVDLNEAILINVDLTKAILKGAKLDNAILKKPKQKKGGNCYLTTACTLAMNLPDDCHELQTLRKFRDGFVSETNEGLELIREYYEISPRIVKAIYHRENGIEIIKELYQEILEVVSLIDNNEEKEAYKCYTNMTLRLKKRYLS